MAKSKIRFNIVDVVIILVIIACIIAVYSIISGKSESTPSEKVTLRYVIKTEPVGSGLENNVQAGSTVFSEDGVIKFGTVLSYEVRPAYHSGKDTTTGETVVSAVDGKYTLYLTVEAQAELSDNSYRVDGMEIYVGKEFTAMTPELLFKCECISIAEKDG